MGLVQVENIKLDNNSTKQPNFYILKFSQKQWTSVQSPRPQGITIEFVGFIPWSLELKSIVLG